jgi:hypothetical protein
VWIQVANLLPDLTRACPEFLRHKELMISPALLKKHNIPVMRVTQVPASETLCVCACARVCTCLCDSIHFVFVYVAVCACVAVCPYSNQPRCDLRQTASLCC